MDRNVPFLATKLKYFFAPMLPALLLCGCVANRAWRIHYLPGRPPAIDPTLFADATTSDCRGPHAPVSGESSAYHLSFIEFDDRGEFFERGQLEQALQTIRQVKEEASAEYPLAVVLFVHGWKNNASDRSPNVAGFKKMLTCLGGQFNPIGSRPDQTRVVGVYIGWRGAVVSAPLLKELTFWDRRDESRNLPGAQLVETLLSIMKTSKGERYTGDGITILIGHSFGGGLLETALTQTLENVVLDTPSGHRIYWPADLTVMINEAAPAAQSYQLIESMDVNVRNRPPCVPGAPGRKEAESYMPAIISMTSLGDWATGFFFPIGQAITRPFNSLRTYPHPNALGVTSQTPIYMKTTALSQPFLSHVLGPDTSKPVTSAEAAGCQVELNSTISGTRYSLVEKPGSKNLSPYWVTQLPTAIVPDHTTMFEAPFRSFMIDLVNTWRTLGPQPYIRK